MDSIATAGRQLLPSARQEVDLHAGFWLRLPAYLIDVAILVLAYLVLCFAVEGSLARLDPLGSGNQLDTVWKTALGLLVGMFFVGIWLYFALLQSSKWQATLGKRAMRLRVTDRYGCRIGFWRATWRFVGKILSLCYTGPIGCMLSGWTARKQALHDLMAGCCVVRKDGLAAFNRGELDPGTKPRVPGWAVALIVLGAAFVLMVIAAIIIPAYKH